MATDTLHDYWTDRCLGPATPDQVAVSNRMASIRGGGRTDPDRPVRPRLRVRVGNDPAGRPIRVHPTLAGPMSHDLDKINEASARNRARRQAEAEAAAESDGLAQVVCRAIRDHIDHGGALPWPSVRKPYSEWAEAQAGLVLVPACRVCGCTDEDCSGCIARTGEPCFWTEGDLCSACKEYRRVDA